MAKKKQVPDVDKPIGAPFIPRSAPWEQDYLTIDEWIDKLSVSLKYHLKESVWPRSDASEVFHPEDLAANSGAFIDAMSHIFPEFGVRKK